MTPLDTAKREACATMERELDLPTHDLNLLNDRVSAYRLTRRVKDAPTAEEPCESCLEPATDLLPRETSFGPEMVCGWCRDGAKERAAMDPGSHKANAEMLAYYGAMRGWGR